VVSSGAGAARPDGLIARQSERRHGARYGGETSFRDQVRRIADSGGGVRSTGVGDRERRDRRYGSHRPARGNRCPRGLERFCRAALCPLHGCRSPGHPGRHLRGCAARNQC
jgi:hypothetical protein